MDHLTDIFNSRELATFLWMVIFIVIFLFKHEIRSSFVAVIKSFFNKYVILLFFLMLLYISLQIYLLYKVNLWDISLIKNSIYWILGVASVLLINIDQAKKEELYFKKLIMRNFKIMVIIEFIVNLYTFSFIAEMFIVPIVTLFVIIAAFTEKKKEYLPVNKIANVIIGIFGFIVLIFSIEKINNDFTNFWVLHNLTAFLLPITLLITFIPFLYLTALYMAYELLYKRLELFIGKDKEIYYYAKKKTFLLCKLNLPRINKFAKERTVSFAGFNNKAGIEKTISQFKKE
ncbi:MAG: hypothetical protein PHY28_06950 [Dehalococcoidales bacterium]|nr:hypothetical protein [Dehalococcoidales bacterium]